VVAAPAIYSKTTLLAAWARAAAMLVAWLSLDRDDNDLEKWVRYLLADWARLGWLYDLRSSGSEWMC